MGQRQPAPALSGTTVEGKQLTVDLLERPAGFGSTQLTVVDFCGSWSADCRALPAPPEVLSHGPPSGIQHIGVDVGDSPTDARSFAGRGRIGYPVLSDATGRLDRAWRVNTRVPYTVIVDPDGLIAARFPGGVTGDALNRAVSTVLQSENGGPIPTGMWAAGIRSVVGKGRTLEIGWANARCGSEATMQAELVEVRASQNVRAVHLAVVVRLNPADISRRRQLTTPWDALETG